ncbi:MAG: flavodoxin domain-containing protein [Defluviitaleaceae bacterium]|nr:flavodoxin domain-containing protein [Defluviitaleaceae bacterium]
MKTLIIYTSKYGCTADCASNIKSKLQGDVTLLDINKTVPGGELSTYDTVIIGGSVYIGKIAKKLRLFCQNNVDALTAKKIGIFLCCALENEADAVLAANFPSALLEKSVSTKVLGSEARLDKMGFLDKTMIKAVSKGDFNGFRIFSERVDEFVHEIMA